MCLDGIFGSLYLLLTTVTGNKRPGAFVGSESRPLLAANNQQPGYSDAMPVVRVTVESYDHVETGEASQLAPPPRHPTLPMSNQGPSNTPMSFFLVLTSRYDPTVDTKQKDPATLIPLAPNKTTEEFEGILLIAHHSYKFYLDYSTQSADIIDNSSVIFNGSTDFHSPLPEFLKLAEPTARLIVLTGVAQRDRKAPVQAVLPDIFQRHTPSLTNLLLRHCLLHPRSILNYTVKHLRLEYGAGNPFAQTFAQTIQSSRNLESLELFEAIPSGIHQIKRPIWLPNLRNLLVVTKASKEDLEALQYFFVIFVAHKDLVIKVVCSEPGPQLGFAGQVGLALEEWRRNMVSLSLS
ncbi:hypothetical protein HGRIS_005559 [Hohenbuehelia grisea]|uniref:Uncharacterized protein n=1 Tax=Hohenbuehelia grisea TaxID=104357 RepID=A0ABR3JXD9_9AGAR